MVPPLTFARVCVCVGGGIVIFNLLIGWFIRFIGGSPVDGTIRIIGHILLANGDGAYRMEVVTPTGEVRVVTYTRQYVEYNYERVYNEEFGHSQDTMVERSASSRGGGIHRAVDTDSATHSEEPM